jgi:hypothetical protein
MADDDSRAHPVSGEDAVVVTNVETQKKATDMSRCYENLIVIDAGANLTNKKYARDLDSVVQRAQDAGH